VGAFGRFLAMENAKRARCSILPQRRLRQPGESWSTSSTRRAPTASRPLGALYDCSEVETLDALVDEFVELPIDASGALGWRAPTMRRASGPPPQPSRIYEIEAPTRRARRASPPPSTARSAARTLGAAVPSRCRPLALEKLGVAAAARDAPRVPLCIRQREAWPARRNRPRMTSGRARREEERGSGSETRVTALLARIHDCRATRRLPAACLRPGPCRGPRRPAADLLRHEIHQLRRLSLSP